MYFLGLLLGALALGGYAVSRSFFRVEEGHAAVLTGFGAAVRDTLDASRVRAFGPGLHRKWPWHRVHTVCVKEQNLELSGTSGGRTCMAADGTILRFDSVLRWAPVESELGRFLFDMEAPLEHVTALFSCLLRSEIAGFRAEGGPNAPGSYALIRRERRELNRRIEEVCRERIGARYGLRFAAVDLKDILPPDELASALNAVINARAEADALYSRAEADCQRRNVAAERGVAIAAARARAAETEARKLASYLDALDGDGVLDDYVARRRAEVLAQSRALYLRRSA